MLKRVNEILKMLGLFPFWLSFADQDGEGAAAPDPGAGDAVGDTADAAPEISDEGAGAEPVLDETPQEGEQQPAKTDDEAFDEARSMGFSEDELKAFGSPDQVRAAMRLFDRRLLAVSRGGGQQPETPKETPPAEKPGEPQEPEKPPTMTTDDFKIALDPEDFSEDLVNTVTGLHEHHSHKLDALRSEVRDVLGHIIGAMNQRAVRDTERDLHAIIRDWNDPGTFGKASFSQLQPDSEQRKNWIKLDSAMRTLARGYEAMGIPVPDNATLARRARSVEFGEKLKQQVRQEIQKEVEDRLDTAIPRPTHTRAANVDDAKAAQLKAVGEFHRKKGVK